MSERRNHELRLIRKLALLKLASGEIIERQTRDMSVGAAFIEYDSDVEFHEGDSISTEIFASISHAEKQGVGCNFLKINSVYYQFMSRYYD